MDSFTKEKNSHAKQFAEAVGSYFEKGNKGGGIESFAELLDAYNPGMNEDVQIGDRIEGEVISIGMDTVFVNTGAKIDGAVEKVELLDENGELSCQVGDVLELYIVSLNESEIRLSKALSGIGGLNLLRDAFESGVPVEGKVKEPCKGGFHIEMLQRKAFCPISQMDVRFVENPEEYVGSVHQFLIIRFEEDGRNIVVSRRELLERKLSAARKGFLKEVTFGAVLEGRVSSVMHYGVFVELFPGIEGMAHVSQLSWSRVAKPDDILHEGDPVTVKIVGIEETEKPDQPKISLSMKQVTGDPWESDEERFHIGDKVRGKVTRCINFGAFVEIAPGIEGLVHISEMSYLKRIAKPEEVVQVGDAVDVMVKGVDMEKRRISLSIKEAEGDPWIGVNEKYKVGQSVEGTLEKKEKFGYFVTLEPGITGLLPKSKISRSLKPSLIEKVKEGEPITVVVQEIHPNDRKITLGAGDSDDEGDWRQYEKGGGTSLGSLGEKLQQALNSRKE